MSENGNNRSRGARASATVKNARSGNNKNAGNLGSASGQNRNTSNSKGKDDELRKIVGNVVLVIVLIVLFLCNFRRTGDNGETVSLIGPVGDALSGFFFGVFGYLSYVTPICVGALFFGYRYGKHKPDAMKIIISSVCLYFLIGIICDMVSNTGVGMESYSFTNLFNLGHDTRCGGGLVSGSVAYMLKHFIGTVGLVLILILGIIICLLFITRGYIWTFISGLFSGYAKDREVRVAGREERKARELAKRQNMRNVSENNGGNEINDPSDKSLVRNKPLPVALSDRNDSSDTETQAQSSDIREETEGVSGQTDSAGEEEIHSGKKEAAKADQNTDSNGYVLTTREKFRNKLNAYNEKNKAERAEKKRLNEEARENNEILKKISVPKDERIVPSRYSHSEEMHEVYVDLDGDVISESEMSQINDSSSFDNLSQNSYQGAAAESDSSVKKGNGYPEGYKAGGKSVSHDGISSSVHNANFERISIKKQEIRSEHTVNITEDFEPIDIKNNIPYNPDLDPDKFDENPERPEEDFASSEESKFSSFDNMNPEDIPEDKTENKTEDKPEDKTEDKTENKPEDKTGDKPKDKTGEINENKVDPYSARKYKFPPVSLLKPGKRAVKADENELEVTAGRLEETLRSFGVNVTVTDYVQGPSVTRFEMTLEPGTKVSKILSLADDIKLSLASADVRIEAPIPGKSAVGIEVPNAENSPVALRTLIESDNFKNSSSTLSFAVGMNIGGETIVTDIAKMPHVLIAGATGSGKSVCINTLIMSIIYKAAPDEVQMILIDPKVVELSVYNGIPHLAIPVVTDPQKASAALNWAVEEMDRRYKLFADLVVRDLKGFNEKVKNSPELTPKYSVLPKIVIIIDELADLMMTCGKEVEASICRLAQLARACGIHLVVATQRPSVDVITGLIKANMPSRMAFAVSSGVDSRTILDTVGAEKLLGKGDMLFYPQGKSKPERVQGAFVSDEEVADVVQFLLAQKLGNPFAETANINLETANRADEDAKISSGIGNASSGDADDRDEFYAEAGRLIINTGKASMGFLQRKFKIGFNRAARIMDNLADDGVVGEESGTKAREILMTIEQFESFLDDNGIK